jgi:O-antigen/teichoic acid export membrane protein
MTTHNPSSSVFDLRFFFSSSIILAGSFVVNVLNYVFTLVISRLLGVEAFGEVTALFSLMLIVSVPAAALSMLMTRQTAYYTMKGQDAVRELFVQLKKNVYAASITFWIMFAVLIPFFSRFLQIPYLPLAIFSILIPITLVSALQAGTLQGLQEFFHLSKQNIISTVVKLAASIGLVYAGYSVVGVMIGLVFASLASWAYGYRATRAVLTPQQAQADSQATEVVISTSLFSTILFTTLLLALLSNVDILLAKHYLSAEAAGQYGALSTLGKILIYGVGAFITVLLPMVSAAHAKNDGGGVKILALSLSVIAASSFCIYLAFLLYPDTIVHLLFGTRYTGIAEHLAEFSIAMACIALATAFINYFVAIHNTSFLYLLAFGIVTEAILIASNHTSLATITQMLVISSMFLLGLMVTNFLLFVRTGATPTTQ